MPGQLMDSVRNVAHLSGSERLLILTPGPHGAAILPEILKSFAQHTCTLFDSDARRLSSVSANEKIQRVQGQAIRMPFRKHSFDAVLSIEALYSIRPPWTVLAELHRVLVPDGKLILIEPSAHGFFSALRDKISGPGKRIFSIDELKYRLGRGDWDIQQIENLPPASEFPKPHYCVRAIKKENPAEPVPQFLTAREMIERRKNKVPQGEELP